MSLNKGKAKVKTKSKSIAKSAGKNKAAVMNTRSPKKPTAISGDTMSNYAMYKRGGKVSKIKKYQPGGRTAAPPIDDSMEGSPTYNNYSGNVISTSRTPSPGTEITRYGKDKYSFMENNPYSDWSNISAKGYGGKSATINTIRMLNKAMQEGDNQAVNELMKELQYVNSGDSYKKGGTTGKKTAVKKYKAGGMIKSKLKKK